MSSLEKRHTGQRGSMQGHRKYSDGLSDTSSNGSFMDDTDREVSNLTDRAFRSLCIGEEAIYNDSEFSSSPTERHKAFAEETQQKTVSHEAFSYSTQQYGEAEVQPEMASTFQHSYVDVTHQEQAFREGSLSYINNGFKEVMWQQSRSTSRVSSLIKAFSSGECYQDSGTCDVILARDRYRDFGSESWDKSAMLSIQRELSEFSSGYQQNFKSGPFQSYRNHFYTSDVAAAVAQLDTTVLMKSSKSKFKALNSTNCFFHSEFSPFQLWEEYNRFSFQSTNVSGFMSANEFPRWYDSPMYKELKDNHRIPNSPCESRRFNQRQIQDVVASQRSRSTVVQKASAIEKRCESEMASNYPPWKKNNNFVRNKLPGNRPSTVSPSNEKTCRPDSNLFSNNKVPYEIVVESNLPSSVTPFNITQLLTPVIHTRQETETSEILQFAHTPSVSDYSSQGETDPKLQTDVKHLRDSYKSKASSLLFNLKDNRKRVKSTYSPTRFKGLELTDRNKQPSKLEGRESRFSDIFVSQETAQENLIGTDARASCNLTREPSVAPITPKDYTDGFGSYDNLTLTSPQIQDRVGNYKSFCGSSEGHSPSTDPLANTEFSTHNLLAQDKSSLTSEGQLIDPSSTFIPARPEIANVLPKAYLPTHSLPDQTSERYGPSDNANQNDLKQRKDFGRKTFNEYSQNEAVKEKCPWDQIGSVKETDGRSESRPFRGEIAALIEMDKQRKATAKQYFVNDSYSVRKETYMQKVNDDIKLGRLAKEEEKEVREDTISPRKTSYSEKPVHDNQLNTFSKSTESYGTPKNSLHNKTSPLTDVYGGLQSFSVKNDFVKGVPEQNSSFNAMATQNTFDQRAHAPLQDYKGQKNEGLHSYQPYRYEPNKQWHMSSTNEDRHTKENVWTQKQSEVIEQSGAKSYTIYNTPSGTLHTLQNEFSANNGAPNPALQDKDTVIPNTDTSDENNTSLPTRQEDRFSINDILAVRDNEQARRLRDNTFVLAKSENPQTTIKYDLAEKLSITEPLKEQEQQGYKVQDMTSPSPGYMRRDFQNANETNTSIDRKDRTVSKDTDKVTTRVPSYKERGQSKQEILTSKLKAHAQKEISAIKEKGLAKQGILARNSTKTRGTINNDGQEGHSVKKEITADKLNHLFQDITYSSVTQYKEQIKLHNDHPKNRSPSSMEIQPLHLEDNQNAVSETKDENVKYKPLAIERQKDKHPADDKEMKETLNRRATVENNVHKNYQPSRISEDKQISMASSEHINTNKESAKQSHEMSPGKSMSGHLTAAVKTFRENYASHNPPALHNEKQTIQHDQEENLYGSRQNQYTSSEKPVTKPTDIIKEDLHITSNETKSNSDLNKNSLLGLEKNTPRVEEANVHLKSKITAAVEQSKNESIKNSSGITSSQLTSSSSDMKFKNGIPPAKRLMEPAKSEFNSNLQTNSLSVDPEQLLNRTYKHNSGVNSDSEVSSTDSTVKFDSGPTKDLALQRTKEPEILKPFNNDDGQVLINKSNITKENELARQQNKTLQVKAVEAASINQIVKTHSKPETDEQSLTQIASTEAKECCQQKELHQNDEHTKTLFQFDKNELPRSHQNMSRIKDDAEVANNSQQKEKITECASSKQEKEFLRTLEISHEKNSTQKSTEESQEGNPTDSKPQTSAENALKPNVSPKHEVVVEEDGTQKNNTQPVLTQIVESTADTSNVTILTPSNEEPREEPMIYSICVSSKTEAVSDDEPMIYTICVSSKCHIDEQQNPVKQEEESSVETEKFVKDESFCIKNKRVENENNVARQTEVSSNIEEKEDKIEKCELPATTDKSSNTGRISTSYEDLLAKYGLPVRDHGHLISKHMQEEREQKEKEETETQLSNKSINHGMNRLLLSKEKSSDTTQTHPDDSREFSNQQASIKNPPLKGTESEIKQVKVQHYDNTSIAFSNNSTPKLSHSTRDATLKLKDIEDVNQDQDTHTEPSRQSRGNDIELKRKKVEEQVRNTDKVQSLKMKGTILDALPNSREFPKKAENISQTAKQPAITGESTRAKKKEILKAPISSTAKDAVDTKLTESTIPSNNMTEEQQSTGISTPKLSHSTRDATVILKDVEDVKQDQDTHIEPSRQSRGNDIELKEKKVEEQVRNTDKVQSLKMKGTILDALPNSREFPKKAENISQTAKKQPAITGESTRAKKKEILKAPISSMAKDAVNTKLTESTIPKILSNNMAEKQQSTGISTPKLSHSTRDATVILKDVEDVKQDQDTHIEPSRQSRGNDIELKEKKVEEQVRNTDKVQSLKMKGTILDALPNSREFPEKTDSVSQTAKKQPAITGESTRAKKKEVLKAPISSMAKDAVNTKLTESTIPEMTIPQAKKKPQKVEGEDKIFNDTDTFMTQKNKIHERERFNSNVEKTVHEAKQKDPVMAMKQESVSDKDAQTLQKNVKGEEKGGEKRSQEKLQVEFNTSNEIINRMKMVLKDGAATHVNNYRDKVSSIGEDVCTVVKQDQTSFEVTKIHLEDIKVSTEEVSSNKEFMAGHKNQHEVIKKENLKGMKGAVVTELVGEKGFTEQKPLAVKPLTVQNEPKTVNNMTVHTEMACTNTHDIGKEIIPLKKDSPSKLGKTEINPRQAVRTQDIKVYDNKQPALNSDKRKKEDPVLSLSGQNDGNLKVNENGSILRGKKERNVETTETKQADWTNTNQCQPGTKGSARYEQEHAQLNQQDTRKEGILSKPEATQRNKKMTRPEISAIADYARLRVISAEDDTKELDIFPKMDLYNNYDKPVIGIHKDLYGNVSDLGGERDNISMEKGQNLKQKSSQFKKQTEKETLPEKQNHLVPNTVQLKPVSLVASGSQDEAASTDTQPRALTAHKESNTKPTFMEHPNRGERNKIDQPKIPQSIPLQAEGTISRSRQMTHDKTTEKGSLSHYGRQEPFANLSSSVTVKAADNKVNMASPPGEEMEELQYYTVNAFDTEIKPKEAPEPPPPSLKMSQNTDSAEKPEEEKKEESSFLHNLTDYSKVHATGPRSNSSSPAMGKPIMFRVKDNTIRTSSVTKTVKPRFHRSFSEDFRIGSPKEHLTGSEKDEIHPKESANPPVLHEPAIAAHRLQQLKETLHNNLPSAEYATKQSKSHQRRSQHFEEEETLSVISTMSEDMEKCAASLTDVANICLAFMPKHESYRDTYQRPASACYERPESACYERPESACSDIRPLGRPPVVPPKSEKALRRAQRLTTRRMKKAETPKMAPENQEQQESKSIRNVPGVPSSSSDILSTHLAVQASPPLSQYDTQPNYTPPTHSIVAQPFPVTQRKLLQDPNSGQYFMVDVPLPVKTKTFYDPETGKYVQLNVRQRSQGALTQPASLEMLNTPYMLYRGFLPMAASSLPPLRSSSEMSTPADNQDTPERGDEPWRQNVYLQNSNRDSQQYPDMLYGSHEQIHNPSLRAENSIDNIERHTDIITMSELEDFAMEST